jgi:predicted nucleic acid-binding protein
MSGDVAYLDTSAFVKLIVPERESRALLRHLGGRRLWASCALLRVESLRALQRQGPDKLRNARERFRDLQILKLDDELLDTAGELQGATLRTLDAIHLAAALSLHDQLAEVVSYDRRMAAAASAMGLSVAAPV